MLKNKNHLEIGEKRVIWQKAGAESVVKMAAQIENDLKEKNINLSDADKEKIAEYKTKEKEIIFWSKKEREKFAESLMKEDDTKKDAKEIIKLIHAEIQNELFETKMDVAARDYKGEDLDNRKIDKNKTRDFIENSFEKKVRDLNLNSAQRKELENLIEQKLKSAFLSDETFIEKHFDSKVTGKEATEIAEFIKNWQPKGEKTESEQEKAPMDWKKQKKEIESILKQKYQTPEWYKKPISKIHPDIQKNIEEKFKNSQNIKELKKLGIDLDLEEMKNGLGIILSTRLGKNIAENLVNKSKTENLAKKIEVRQSNIVRWVNERYGNDAPKILATTFELKGIAKDDERAILEYLAFGNVETDMKASEKYFKANNKINSNETVETNEKIKAEEINKNLKADSENNPDDAGKEALGGFQKALKSFSEVFKQVSFAAGLGKLWEAVMHLWEAVIDGKAWFGGLIIKNIPHGVKESELCPNFVKEWIEDGRKDIKNKEIKDMSAVSALLKLKPADFHIVEDLKNITIAKLLGANADDLNKFTEGKEIDINVAQLATIKGRLVGKNISTQSRETSLSVYDFLKKKKNEKKYLN